MQLAAGNRYLSCNKLNLLITFDRIIKDPDIFILHNIASNYYEQFKEYIDMESLLSLDTKALEPILYARSVFNILEWVSIKEFDYTKNYNFLYNEFKNMYIDSKELKMVETVRSFLTSYCVDRIFIYNEKDDIRQRYDLSLMFGKSKLEYIIGPMKDIIKEAKIHIVYDWNVDRAAEIIDTEEFNHVFFGIAAYGFNFEPMTEEEKKSIFKIPKLKHGLSDRENVAYFQTMKFTKKSFFKG